VRVCVCVQGDTVMSVKELFEDPVFRCFLALGCGVFVGGLLALVENRLTAQKQVPKKQMKRELLEIHRVNTFEEAMASFQSGAMCVEFLSKPEFKVTAVDELGHSMVLTFEATHKETHKEAAKNE